MNINSDSNHNIQNDKDENLEQLENNLSISKELYNAMKNLNIDELTINENINNIVKEIYSENIEEKFRGLICLNKLLTKEEKVINQQIIDLQIIPNLIAFLGNYPNEIINEALCCLIYLSNRKFEQSMTIILYGGINKIIPLIDSKIEELKINSILFFKNLLNDSDKIRKILLDKGVFDKILEVISFENNQQLLENLFSALSKFFSTKLIQSYEKVHKSFEIIGTKIVDNNYSNIGILTNALTIFIYYTDTFPDRLDDFSEIKLIEKIIGFLDKNDNNIITKSLYIINRFSEGSDKQTQIILDYNVLDKLKKTLFYEGNISLDTGWILSNIACGTQKQKETLFQQNFLQMLIKSFNENVNKKPSLFALCNLTTIIDKNSEYLQKLMNEGIIKVLFKGLKIEDRECLLISLEAFDEILNFGKKMHPTIKNPFSILMKKMEIIPILENLKLSSDESIRKKVLYLMNEFFN